MIKKDKLRVSLAFNRGGDHEVDEVAGAVLANLYNQAAFSAPPVVQADLQAGLDAFVAAVAAQAQGGTAATAAKRNRRDELVAMLEKLALYVQVVSDNDMATLLSSGFTAMRNNRTRTALATPTGVKIRNGISGEALVSVTPVENARCYEVFAALVDDHGTQGEWKSMGVFTSSRNMRVTGLVPGKVYLYQLRAVGGTTGYSGMSDAVSHRAA